MSPLFVLNWSRGTKKDRKQLNCCQLANILGNHGIFSMSSLNHRSDETDLLDAEKMTNGFPVDKRFLSAAGIILIAILLGLFFGDLAIVNLQIALIIAAVILIMVISTDLSWAWAIFFIASTLSGLFFRRSSYTLRPDQLVFVWIILVWLYYFITNQVRIHRVPLAVPMVGIVLTNLVSSYLYSPDKSSSYQSCFLFALYLSMFFVTVNILNEKKELAKIAPLLLVVVGLLQAIYSFGAMVVRSKGINIFGASYSTGSNLGISVNGGFQESNIFAAFIVVVSLMILAHIVARSHWHQGVRLYIGLAVVFLMLLLTFTRAAWASFAVVSILMVVVLRPPKNIINPRGLAVIAALVAFFILVALPVGNYVTGITGGSTTGTSERIQNLFNISEGSGEGRLQVESRAIERWKNSPILGDGTFGFPGGETGTATHGSWLYSSIVQSLHDTGIVGFVFLMWIYIGGLIIGIRGYRRCQSVYWRATLMGGTLGWLSLTIASQASSFIWLSFPWLFLGALVTWATNAPAYELEEAAGKESAIPRSESSLRFSHS